jgi:hypothetical protein
LPGLAPPPPLPFYYFVDPNIEQRQPADRQRILVQDTTIGPNTLTYVQVFDAAGIMVHEQIVKGQIVTIDIPYKKGVYLIKAGRRIKKVVVQ